MFVFLLFLSLIKFGGSLKQDDNVKVVANENLPNFHKKGRKSTIDEEIKAKNQNNPQENLPLKLHNKYLDDDESQLLKKNDFKKREQELKEKIEKIKVKRVLRQESVESTPLPTTKLDELNDEDFAKRIQTPAPKYDPILHVIFPSQIPESGRVNVTIRVTLTEPGKCYCKIDNEVLVGNLDSEGLAVFLAPPHAPGIVNVQFSKDRFKWYGNVQLEYLKEDNNSYKILSIALGIILTCLISFALFTLLTSNQNKKKMIDPSAVSKLRNKGRHYNQLETAPKKRSNAIV